MNSNETPRVSGKMLPQYLGRMVFLICDTSNVGQDHYGNQIVRTTDGIDVVVSLPPGEQFESRFVHFLAKVVQPNAVEVQSIQAAGDNLDVDQYNKAIELMYSPKFSHLFV